MAAGTMLKTYNARTMAEALAQVKNDLGRDAVIVHTRTFRIGGVMGFGGRPIVEVTATAGAPNASSARRQPTRVVGRVPTAARPQGPIGSPLASTVLTRPVQATQQPTPADLAAAAGRSDQQPPVPMSAPSNRIQADPSTRETEVPSPERQDAAEVIVKREVAWPPERNISPAPDWPRSEASKRPESQTNASPAPSPESGAEPLELRLEAFDPSPPGSAPAPRRQSEPIPDTPTDRPIRPSEESSITERSPASVERELSELKRMMGQVLQSTRRAEARTGDATSFAGATPQPLLEIYTLLTEADVDPDEAERVVGEVRDELDPEELRDERAVRETTLRRLERRIPTRTEVPPARDRLGRPSVIALIGPTGVGKTTTVAKLAATYKLRHGRRVGLVTADTYRIAAVEQLRTYAGIINLPLKVAMTPQDVEGAIESLSDCDVIVLDTAGRSQNDTKRLDELREILKAASPDQTHMVLSTTVGQRVLGRTIERFGALGPDRAILTKLDEAESFGLVLDAARLAGVPISYVTVGQEVPDDLEAARSERLARLVLGGGVEVST